MLKLVGSASINNRTGSHFASRLDGLVARKNAVNLFAYELLGPRKRGDKCESPPAPSISEILPCPRFLGDAAGRYLLGRPFYDYKSRLIAAVNTVLAYVCLSFYSERFFHIKALRNYAGARSKVGI